MWLSWLEHHPHTKVVGSIHSIPRLWVQSLVRAHMGATHQCFSLTLMFLSLSLSVSVSLSPPSSLWNQETNKNMFGTEHIYWKEVTGKQATIYLKVRKATHNISLTYPGQKIPSFSPRLLFHMHRFTGVWGPGAHVLKILSPLWYPVESVFSWFIV